MNTLHQSVRSRREVLSQAGQFSAALALPSLLQSYAHAASFKPTPSQSEGPFYPDQALSDSDADLLRNGATVYAAGQAAWVSGIVTDLQGKPVSGAVVEIWQCDHEGTYRHSSSAGSKPMAFQGFGRVQVGADGLYRFRTIKPVPYTGRPPHIHFKVKLGSKALLTTQMYLQGEASNTRDFLTRGLSAEQRSSLEVGFSTTPDGLSANFPLRVIA
jgi:protocatechuate 3,4-dioxygenase, beta subunit